MADENPSPPSMWEKLRGKRTSDISLPNTRPAGPNRKDPRLRTKLDQMREGAEIVRGVVKRAKQAKTGREKRR